MNRTPIEWVRNLDGSQGFSWNPWGMYCAHGCPYCYVDRSRHRSPCADCRDNNLHLHLERMDQPLKRKKPSTIFVCSCADLFDATVPDEWRERVLAVIKGASQHLFIAPTKQPAVAQKYDFPPNFWLGVSVENQQAADLRIPQLLKCNAALRFVSYEPAHGPVDWSFLRFCPCGLKAPFYKAPEQHHAACTRVPCINWLIVGAESGKRKDMIVPKREWLQSAVDRARAAGVPVFVKRKVVELFPEFAGIEEFPSLPQRHRGAGNHG